LPHGPGDIPTTKNNIVAITFQSAAAFAVGISMQPAAAPGDEKVQPKSRRCFAQPFRCRGTTIFGRVNRVEGVSRE
jgi:hypothetical protein